MKRIDAFLVAEELEDPYSIDSSSENKYDIVANGSFTWESVGKASSKFDTNTKSKEAKEKEKKIGSVKKDEKSKKWWHRERNRSKSEAGLPAPVTSGSASASPAGDSLEKPKTETEKEKDEAPFALTNVSLRIPKGNFVAIVGRVGSGKSSLLQSLVGEMRKIDGEVVFGGSVAYVPQQPWIMNATLRNNILFGREEDVARWAHFVSITFPSIYDVTFKVR